MATKPVKMTDSAKRKFGYTRRILQAVQGYLEMPPTASPTLPEVGLAKTRIRSWPLASAAVGAGIYLLFVFLALLDGTVTWLASDGGWRWPASMVFSALIIYLLFIMPILRRLLADAVHSFLPFLPDTEHNQRLMAGAYRLKRRWEWLAVGFGVIVGWVPGSTWERHTLALTVYWVLGSGLAFGLAGWHVYSALARTRMLAEIYGRAYELNIRRQTMPTGAIARWIIGVIVGLMGGIPLMGVFVDLENLERSPTLLIYGPLILLAIIFIIFRKVPTSLSRVSMVRAVFLFALVATIGTLGFAYFEGWRWDDALYATIITMTTVGYGDFSPSSDAGQFFTIVLSLIAVGIGGYAVSSFAAFIVEGNFNLLLRGKNSYKLVDKLSNHIILCGAGQVGKNMALEFYKTRVPFVVIEQDPTVMEELLREIEIPYIEGDATQNHILELAGIDRARGLVTALSDDKSNAFVILSARELAKKHNNPALRTVARLNEEKQKKKLERAGADVTVSPKATGGRRMAGMMLYPSVYSFLDEMLEAEKYTGQTLRLEEVYIDKINNPTLMELIESNQLRVSNIGQYTGLLVVAIKRQEEANSQTYLYTPRGDTLLQPDDILIVLGTPEERAKLKDAELPTPFEVWQSKTEAMWRKWERKLTGHSSS